MLDTHFDGVYIRCMLARTNIYLPVKTIKALKQKADAQGNSMSELIRQALEKELQKESEDWAQSLLQLAKKAKKGGPSDLSRNHDKYLYS